MIKIVRYSLELLNQFDKFDGELNRQKSMKIQKYFKNTFLELILHKLDAIFFFYSKIPSILLP